MLDFFKKLIKVGAITEFVAYIVFALFIIFGGFWIDLGIISIILLHRFGKVIS